MISHIGKIIVLLVLVIYMNSCSIRTSAYERYIKPVAIVNSPLRMDGYYYCIHSNDSYKSIAAYFFYNNGSVLTTGERNLNNNLTDFEKTIRLEQSLFSKQDQKIPISFVYWTNFSILRDSISLERLYPWNGYPHYLLSGHIINSTSFVLQYSRGLAHVGIAAGDRKKKFLRDTFYFKEFHPKPDSLADGNYNYKSIRYFIKYTSVAKLLNICK